MIIFVPNKNLWGCVSVSIRLLYPAIIIKSVYVPHDLYYASVCADECNYKNIFIIINR